MLTTLITCSERRPTAAAVLPCTFTEKGIREVQSEGLIVLSHTLYALSPALARSAWASFICIALTHEEKSGERGRQQQKGERKPYYSKWNCNGKRVPVWDGTKNHDSDGGQ